MKKNRVVMTKVGDDGSDGVDPTGLRYLCCVFVNCSTP